MTITNASMQCKMNLNEKPNALSSMFPPQIDYSAYPMTEWNSSL